MPNVTSEMGGNSNTMCGAARMPHICCVQVLNYGFAR
jgi:hypothetical protein